MHHGHFRIHFFGNRRLGLCTQTLPVCIWEIGRVDDDVIDDKHTTQNFTEESYPGQTALGRVDVAGAISSDAGQAAASSGGTGKSFGVILMTDSD